MGTVHLFHWNDGEALDRAARLRDAGFSDVVADAATDGLAMKRLRADPPAAFVIDLSRLPSHGSAVAHMLRASAATRRVPIVFVDGAPEKLARVREKFPDATYTTWTKIGPALRRAIERPPANPVVPVSPSGAYSPTPLPKKLGVKVGSAVVLVNGPAGFERVLGDLPAGATVCRRRGSVGPADGERCGQGVTLWFVRSADDLRAGIKRVAAVAGDGGLWVCWPKRASGVVTDLTEDVVRAAALPCGIVDYKVCAVDATWSGLKFGRRRKGERAARSCHGGK